MSFERVHGWVRLLGLLVGVALVVSLSPSVSFGDSSLVGVEPPTVGLAEVGSARIVGEVVWIDPVGTHHLEK